MKFCLFLLIPFLLFGKQWIEISSDSAELQDKELLLSGNVTFHHPMGTLHSEKAHVLNFRFPKTFSDFFFEQGVTIHLNQASYLQADTAHIDAAKKTIFFHSKDHLFLSDTRDDKSFTLQAKRACAEYQDETALIPFELESFYFFDDIVMHYDKTMQARGGTAVFKNAKKSTGTIDLYPTIPFKTCSLQKERDEILASKIHFNLFERTLYFTSAKGRLFFKENLTFSSDLLIFDQKKHLFHLKKNALVEKDESFSLASEEIELKHTPSHFFPQTVLCQGLSTLNVSKAKLSVDGAIFVNHETNHITLTPEKDFVVYEDPHLSLKSEFCECDYQFEENFILKNVCFSKNVQMIYDHMGKPCYAIADFLIYDPDRKILTLKSIDTNRVLLWQGKDFKISAAEIQIHPDKEIKGIGNVHFTFNKEENKHFYKIFENHLH